MRYLCTNPDCSAFAHLVAGSQQTCPACGQRVLDERVMLKRGHSLQAIIATKGRIAQTPAPAPRQDESILDPPTWREERDLAPRRPYAETRALFTKEQLSEELAKGSRIAISQKHHIALGTVDRLLQDFGVENPRARGNRAADPEPAKEGTPVAEVWPQDLAPGAVARALATANTSAEEVATALGLSKPATPPATLPTSPTPEPRPGGFRFQITRSGQAKSTVVGDVDALAAAVEHLQVAGRFNLTVILEEAS